MLFPVIKCVQKWLRVGVTLKRIDNRLISNSHNILLLPLLQPRSDDFGSGGHGGNPDLVALVS